MHNAVVRLYKHVPCWSRCHVINRSAPGCHFPLDLDQEGSEVQVVDGRHGIKEVEAVVIPSFHVAFVDL